VWLRRDEPQMRADGLQPIWRLKLLIVHGTSDSE